MRRHPRIASSHERDAERPRFAIPEPLGRRLQRAAVDLADRHAVLRELRRRRRILLRPHRALPLRGFERRAFERRAKAGRQARQRGRRGPQPEHAGDVPRARHEARDLVEALLQRRARVVLVAVDHARLERRIDFAEGHRRGAGAHQLDGLDVDRRLDRPDLEPGELAGFGDVARPRDHLPEAERVAPGERPHPHGAVRDSRPPRVRPGRRRCCARAPSRAT